MLRFGGIFFTLLAIGLIAVFWMAANGKLA
jgi:hypothetical protein